MSRVLPTRFVLMTERTLVLIKPDAVERGLTGRILGRYLAKGLTLVAMEMRTASAELSDAHYRDHVAKTFYPALKEFITSGPLVAVVLEGERAIDAVRALNGATDGVKAVPGSIRGDWCLSNQTNLVHGSDSAESAAREVGLWFPEL